MSLGAVLDVIIGLSFTYLLLGILASGAQELVATWMQKRGRDLRKGIARLLAGTDATGKPSTRLFEKVFGHGLIEDLSTKKLPSYIPARNFALALLETLRDGSQAPLFSQIENSVEKLPAGTARESLQALVTEAAGDLDALQHGIETWFNDAMDRLSGVYKRFSQHFTLIFGLVVAVGFNVDSITLAQTLWTDPAAREATAAMAQHYVETHPKSAAKNDGSEDEGDDVRAQINNLKQQVGLPIGWTRRHGETGNAWHIFWERIFQSDGSGIWLVIGWVITALAVSLGAPFWFDSLQGLLQLRNSGPKPARTADASGNGAT
jgi:hypothetical protein